MSTRLYPLPGGDGDGTKVWYSLGLGMGMGMRMNFLCGDGYVIAKPVPARPVAIPDWNVHFSVCVEFCRISGNFQKSPGG